MSYSAVLGTGAALPGRVVSNQEVGAPAGVDGEWIARKTGIQRRRWATATQSTSDLAVTAAREALRRAGVPPDRLDLIVVATSTPDQPQPPTAAAVQHRLGARRAAAFDLNAVCSGFVFALATARSALATSGGYALVIGADVYSRILDPADRRTVVLFGDGAGAAVLGPDRRGGVVATRLHTYGERRDLIEVPAAEGRFFSMNGRAVREFVQDNVPGLVRAFLADTGTAPADVAHVVPHQANGVMLDDLAPALGLPNAAVHRTITEYGNTGAASVPITLHTAAAESRFAAGDRILLVAFGGGMSAGMALVVW